MRKKDNKTISDEEHSIRIRELYPNGVQYGIHVHVGLDEDETFEDIPEKDL
jgi:hypothetical protein